jgi:hypothetical protein
MLDAGAFRDRIPTSPYDLSEYAREQTGPASWSAHPEESGARSAEDDESWGGGEKESGAREALSTWALSEHCEPYSARTTELLSNIGPSDVPFINIPRRHAAEVLDDRETLIMAAVDGRATCAMLLDTIALPPGDVLAILCNLCARGFLVLGE